MDWWRLPSMSRIQFENDEKHTHTHNINYDQIKTKYRQTASGLSVCRSVNSELMSGRTNDANESNEMAT